MALQVQAHALRLAPGRALIVAQAQAQGFWGGGPTWWYSDSGTKISYTEGTSFHPAFGWLGREALVDARYLAEL